MLDAAVKALSQMFSPPFRTRAAEIRRAGACARSCCSASACIALLSGWRASGEGWAESMLGGSAHTPLMIASWILSIAAGLGIIAGAIFLMPAVTALVASLFADDIALEVERSHYPGEPVGTPLPLARAGIRRHEDRAARGRHLSRGGAVPAVRGHRRRDLLPRNRLPARPRIFRACRDALPSGGRGQTAAQGRTTARSSSPACSSPHSCRSRSSILRRRCLARRYGAYAQADHDDSEQRMVE